MPAGARPRRQRGATGSRPRCCSRGVYRAGALVDAAPGGFVPAVVVDERPAPAPVPSRIEIVTPNGYRVLAGADVDEAALVRVLAVLARA